MKLIRKDVDGLGIEMAARKLFVIERHGMWETFYDETDALMAIEETNEDPDIVYPYDSCIYVFEATHMVDVEKLRRMGKSEKYIKDKLIEDRRAYASIS